MLETNSTEHSRCETDSRPGGQKIPRILWKKPPLDSILSQLNPVYIPTPYFIKINFNIILFVYAEVVSSLQNFRQSCMNVFLACVLHSPPISLFSNSNVYYSQSSCTFPVTFLTLRLFLVRDGISNRNQCCVDMNSFPQNHRAFYFISRCQ